jgi:hypothetical protein
MNLAWQRQGGNEFELEAPKAEMISDWKRQRREI